MAASCCVCFECYRVIKRALLPPLSLTPPAPKMSSAHPRSVTKGGAGVLGLLGGGPTGTPTPGQVVHSRWCRSQMNKSNRPGPGWCSRARAALLQAAADAERQAATAPLRDTSGATVQAVVQHGQGVCHCTGRRAAWSRCVQPPPTQWRCSFQNSCSFPIDAIVRSRRIHESDCKYHVLGRHVPPHINQLGTIHYKAI
jgi:hypothetical protein